MKVQLSIEFILIVALIVMLAVTFFYFYTKSALSENTNISIIFSNFQINSYLPSNNLCAFNFSFQSTSSNFASFPLKILTENYTGSVINATVNSTYFSVSSYPLSNNFYQYNYNFIGSSYPFNSEICNEFTQYQSSTSGQIIGLGIVSNGKSEIFKFSSPIPTYLS
jgi:hypothetical protein